MRFSMYLAFLLVHGSMCTSLRNQHKKPKSHESRTPLPDVMQKPTSHPDQQSNMPEVIQSQKSNGESKSLSPKPPADMSLSHEVEAMSEKQMKAPMYAFSANLSIGGAISDETIIVFRNVLANVGGLYVNTSGQFVCPDDGLYVFAWSIQKARADDYEDMRCITSLRKSNTRYKFGPKTSYFSTEGSGSTEMMTVLQCQPITVVTVVTESWSNTILLSVYEQKSSFSGFKLQSSIAFTAELSTAQYLLPGGKVIFDRVVANFGNHYDESRGFFHCPDDGIYVFSVSAYTTNSTTPWSVSRLMKEGQVVVQGPITYIATATHDSGSNSITAVVQCGTGQSLYVESQAAHDFSSNSYAPELTSFTGFKLYDVSDPAAVAFTAVMSSNFSASGDYQILPIDQVVTNIGNRFDASLHAFICPDDDYYMFTWTAASNYGDSRSTGRVILYNDERRIVHLHMTPQSEPDDTGTSGSSTYSAVWRCVINTHFLLRLQAGSDRVLLAGYTLFSAYKIPGDF